MVLQLHAHQQLAVQQRVYIQGRKTKIKHAAFSVQRKLGQPWLTKVGPGMNEVAERCHLKIPEESNVADFEFLGKDSTRFRNRPLAGDKTTRNYEMHLRQFWRFAAFKGDYESMLMLLKKPPAHCPSMSVNTLEEYMRFKRLEPDEPLLDEHGTPVLDVFGTPITCEGGWIAPKNIKIFRAAIFDLHIANNQTSEEYEEQCEDCRALPDDQRLDGCEHHPHNPSRYRRGNPTRHQTFRNTVITMDQVAVEKGYQETGSSQLLPSDLRLLRGRLLSTNSIVDLRDWVIDILATKQALRHDEFHNIHENDFLPELFEITDDRIDALAFQVYGKCDNRWCQLKLHSDHATTDLCPVRALLVYLHLIGWKGGYIFPSQEELSNPPCDFVYKTHIDYQCFLKDLKNVCKATLPTRTPELKIGCQVFRKTFYVIGVFGQAGECELKNSARHKSIQNSLIYRKSAMMDYNTHLNSPVPSNNVSKWKPILVDHTSGNTMLLVSMGGSKILPIADVPDFFVHTILRVPKESPAAKNKQYLIEKARSYVPVDSPSQKLAALLTRLPVEESTLLQEILNGLIAERLQQMLAKSSPALLAATADTHNPLEPQVPCTGVPVPVTPASPVTLPKRKRNDENPRNNDLEGHDKVKYLKNSRLKLNAMMSLAKEKSNSTVPLTGRAKTWASRYLTPLMDCLKDHFGNDPEKFLAAHPAYHPTTFPTKYCNGKGTQCSHRSV